MRIGVLSHRGTEATFRMWSPTADYLTQQINGHTFEIVPLDFDRVDPTVSSAEVDFILVNPGIYVNLEVRHRVSRVATLSNKIGGEIHNQFGGVIFTRRDNREINRLDDLRRKRFMAVDRTSLGGYQMIWGELNDIDIDPRHDFSSLSFGGTHDNVVMAVRNGEVDAGTVRTNILERMADSGQITLDEFKVISPITTSEFPFLKSTRLYPEWPFSKVQHTSNALAQQVAIALLNIPADHQAAISGNYTGWTVPLDYQPVHELFHKLKLPPYDKPEKFTLVDVFNRYFYGFILGVIVLIFMLIATSWILRLNRELRKAKLCLERQHALILNSVADGIYGVDDNGNSTFVNQAMEEITGWKAEEIIGKNQHELLHHTRADGSPFPACECPVYATLHDSKQRFISDDTFWKKDGSSFPVEYASSPLKDDKGKNIGSVVIFRDVSERKMAEERARQHQVELAHVARLNTMGEMASGIAHEINQPLTAIATNAHACIRLLDSGEDQAEKVSDIIDRISEQAERAGEIIRQLRRFVRKEEPELLPVDLNTIVEESILLLTPEAKKSNVKVKLNLDRTLKKVPLQTIQIQQVILNLAYNAIDAMSEVPENQRHLTITTATAGNNAITLSVTDTGPGIDSDLQEQLFNPFITTKSSGMGLGLSISMGIVDMHKGSLFLSDSSSQGSTFRFTLPLNPGGQPMGDLDAK
ncbi:MAG: PhnD/SsuA/transferrin family substrate-binding protein [Gammaproteobacteria bacterium]|nr:PhnD/SsuA/transferrin family substrate-binding protein [Gammaproteobacteria bacterium]